MTNMNQAARWSICLAACLLIAGGAIADDSYSILGTVTTDTGKPLAGVTVDFGEKLPPVITDDAGYYESAGAVEGAVYLVEPAAARWTFAPARRAVVMGSGDEQVNFTAEAVGGRLAGLLFAPPTAASAQPKAGGEDIPEVLYPLAGETWTQGQAYNIRWTYEGHYAPMKIRLLKGGANYVYITDATPDDGSPHTGSGVGGQTLTAFH